ncbi:methyltransferase [Planctomycetota bacterium]
MSEEPSRPEEQIMRWLTTKWITKPIYVAAELGIADLLDDGPLSVEALALETDTHAPTLYRLLRALSAVGVFLEVRNGIFESTPLGRCLGSGKMRPLVQMFMSRWHDQAWDCLSRSVRTGQPAFVYAHGKSAFDWLEENPEAREVFDRAQGCKAAGFANAVLCAYDFSDKDTVCDLGGGRGDFLRVVLAAHSHLRGIVADLPASVRSAAQLISESGLQDRCTAIVCDLFEDDPPSADAFFLVNVLHDWDDDACHRILSHLAGAISGSKLLIVEHLLEPSAGLSVTPLLDLEVLVMGGGRERTLEEFGSLLAGSGMSLERTIPLRGGPTILECGGGR